VALLKIDVSEERINSIIRLKRIGELGTEARCEEMQNKHKKNSVAFSPRANYTD
jgi:hypothetical protein